MFQGLRTNSLFYVLDKGENPNLRIGQVVSVSNPQTKYPTFNNGFTPQPMETVVDVKVKLGDEEVDFKQLPANGQIANDKNLVVSDNKDAMSAEVDALLLGQGVEVKNKAGYDHVYVANMARADFYKSSIKDEEQLAQFIKDMVDDADQKDGFIFNRFYADCCHNGVPIPT